MSTNDQLEYFRMRAQIERSLAEDAGDTLAGLIHMELCERYEAAIERFQHRPKLSIVTAPRDGGGHGPSPQATLD